MDRRKALWIFSTIAATVSGGYLSLKHTHEQRTPLNTLQDIVLPDLNKNIRTGSEWLGKVVVVNHWATWCGPCREEIPMLIEFQKQFSSDGVQVIGLAHDQLDNTRIFADTVGLNYPSLIAIADGAKWLKAHGNNIGGLPFTVVFDRRGKLKHSATGLLKYQQLFDFVKPLL